MKFTRRTIIGAAPVALAARLTAAKPAVLDQDLPIIDPHIHLWDLPHADDPLAIRRFLAPDLMALLAGGHNIVGFLYVEASSMYRADGPTELRSLGETEFATGQAAMVASGAYGRPHAFKGMVAKVDLSIGERAGEVMDRHAAVANGRLKGIRQSFAYADFPVFGRPSNPKYKDLLAGPGFRAGVAQLASRGLIFEGWGYHIQLDQFADLARSFPHLTMVLDHAGAPLTRVPGTESAKDLFDDWRRGMQSLARLPNVHVKIGGLGQVLPWEKSFARAARTTANELAAVWRPYVETCVDLFGAQRCMFESNYPADASTCSYEVLWNAFKILAAKASSDERTALFSGTASRVYTLGP